MKSILQSYFNKTRGNIVPGAHRLQKLLSKWLESGILNLPSILVTGSNGKGSTCAYLEIILREHGFKTGLYTSPHLVHPTERIRMNGIPVSEQLLEQNIIEIQEQVDTLLPDATFFEIATAAAFLIFFKEKVDFLVCEVGLGGHFDSTNALSPLISILTSISIEHADLLGATEKKIAADKSYISRRNRAFIIPKLSQEAFEGVTETVKKIGSELVFCEMDEKNDPNLQIALKAIDCLFSILKIKLNHEKIKIAEKKMFWPGRFDKRIIRNRTVIFDAAHNPNGFQFFLNKFFQSQYSKNKCVLLFSSLNDKNWSVTLKQFYKIADHVILTEINSDRSESVKNFIQSIEELKNKQYPFPSYETIENMQEAIEKSFDTFPHLPLVITGSIAFIGSVMEYLDIEVFGN